MSMNDFRRDTSPQRNVGHGIDDLHGRTTSSLLYYQNAEVISPSPRRIRKPDSVKNKHQEKSETQTPSGKVFQQPNTCRRRMIDCGTIRSNIVHPMKITLRNCVTKAEKIKWFVGENGQVIRKTVEEAWAALMRQRPTWNACLLFSIGALFGIVGMLLTNKSLQEADPGNSADLQPQEMISRGKMEAQQEQMVKLMKELVALVRTIKETVDSKHDSSCINEAE